MKRGIYNLLVTLLPANLKRMMKFVISVCDVGETEWARRSIDRIVKLRDAGFELFANGSQSYGQKCAYILRDAMVSTPKARIRVAGNWLVESFGNPIHAPFEALCLKLFACIPLLSRKVLRLPENNGKGYVYCRCDGYYHFVAESLVSLLYSLKVCPDACVVVRKSDYERCVYFRAYIKLLQELGFIRALRQVDAEIIHAPLYVMTALEKDSGFIARDSIQLLRTIFCGQNIGSGVRQIFLTRKGRRRFTNQEQIEAEARNLGLEVVDADGMDVADQIALFRDSKVIVANHGAGLTNLIYSNKGTKVVEIFSPKWRNDCFERLALLRGLYYQKIEAEDDGGWGVVRMADFCNSVKKML